MHGTAHDSPYRFWITSLLTTVLASHLAAAQVSAVEQLAAAKAGVQSSQPNVRKLEPSKPIERELSGGESHSYEITLSGGQYLNVIVDQRGIDVVVTVISPEDKQLMQVDSPNGTQGPEPVMLVAEVSGNYRLNVGSFEKDAPKGRNEIRVMELRSATPKDRALENALNLFLESVRMTAKGQLDAALPLAERVLAIRESALGSEHIDVAESLHNLGVLYELQRNYREAERPYSRALAIRDKLLGPDHLDVAQSLNNLGWVYHNLRDYAKAEPLYQRALAIREKILGFEHLDLIQILNNLAQLYSNEENYAKAEPFYRRALAIREKMLGPDHRDVARSLNNLVELYLFKGDYEKVEPLGQRALRLLEKTTDVDPFDIASSLTHLALLYDWRGEFTKAEILYQRVLTIMETGFGLEAPEPIFALNNFAAFYVKMEEYEKAETLYLRALRIADRKLAPDSHDLAATLNNLADMYRFAGEYAKAEPLSHRALNIWEGTFGPEHHNVALPLNILADIHRVKGDYDAAVTLYQRALAIREKAFGLMHPLVADSMMHLARTYQAKGDTKKAIGYLLNANDIIERSLALNLATGSERQKLLYLVRELESTNAAVSIHTQCAPNDSTARHLAITTILRRKARSLDAMTDSLSALRGRLNEQDRALLDQLRDSRSQLATLVFKRAGAINIAQRQAEIKRMEEEIEHEEAEISFRSAEFRAQSQPVTIDAIQALIPRNTALVELASYTPFNPKFSKLDERFGKPRYVAYVLRNLGEPAWVELGDAKAIDTVIDALRQALRDPNRKDVKQQARAVEEKVFHPVRKLLGDTRRVLISPDGALNLIPFAALVDERDQYLVKQYSFSYLTSGRDLLRLQVKTPSKQAAIVLADPDFGGDTTPCLDRKLKLSKGAVDFSRVLFCPLTGTAGEARALQALMPDATVLTRQQATEAAVKQAGGPKILHIATHGFFLEDVLINPAAAARGVLIANSKAGAAIKVENPLLRSGLAMAGANLHKSGDDDGVLTALEVSGLDLWGTKLVVLSACDTGVGEVKNGDGVYGLRRALVLAGSESQVMSLWSVNDEATRDLMIDYYTRLQAGGGRAEALRQVQLKMLASKNRQHPYYWASFIQSGEWANLDGKR
jgi:CHAT domain-containing protein/Tfp pilus assembly protein PilF